MSKCTDNGHLLTLIFWNIYHIRLFFYRRNQTGQEALVEEAASEFRNYCYNYRDSLMAGIIVAGWDKQLGGQVYSIPIGGMCTRQKCTIGGSGSSYIYAFVREFYKEKMQKDECIEFVKKGKSYFESQHLWELLQLHILFGIRLFCSCIACHVS